MAASEANGTQSATISTEHTLGSQVTTLGTFMLICNLENLVDGDEVTLRAYQETLAASGSTELLDEATFKNAQGRIVVQFGLTTNINGLTYKLEQTAGTGRNFEWEIIQVDG